jgi:hypothetical protein
MAERRTELEAGVDPVQVALSREDEASIRTLAEELRVPVNRVKEIYARELARLRLTARFTTFLPLVVSRLVRRRHFEAKPLA